MPRGDANALDLTGRVFHRLTVLRGPVRRTGITRPRRYWMCRCECGTERAISAQLLTNGKIKSCGCLNRELAVARAASINKSHGLTETKEYCAWSGIKARCYRPGSLAYHNYGGRGIVMSDEWRDSFEAFYRDMGPAPAPDYSVERLDNDGPYSADNCKWIPKREQAKNTRASIRYGDVTGAKAIAAIAGCSPERIAQRWREGKRGAALVKPPRHTA